MSKRDTRLRNPGTATLYCAIGLISWLAGCQHYHAQPLSADAVDQHLKPPDEDVLRIAASTICHPLLPPVVLDPQSGLTPDEAAVLAVLVNPQLRAQRDQRGLATAALMQAGLLPNPVLAFSSDFNNGGFTTDTFNAYGTTVSWDFEQLVSHSAKVRAADLSAQSVDLAIAWQEWQTAEAAKQAVYDLISLQAQLGVLNEIDARLGENFNTVKRAAAAGLETAVDLAAADAAARDAHTAVLQARRDVEHQWLQLTRALGLPPGDRPKLRDGLKLPSTFHPPDAATMTADLETRRIDLIALRRGYESQEQTLRAAILDQFPKINLGVNEASDNSNVHSVGLVASIDLPVFDRNQGAIATERATRKKLFDEYVSRVFDSRADIATALADLKSISAQIVDAQTALPSLQKLVDAYQKALRLGDVDVLSFYAAWNNLAQKRLGVLKLKQQLADTRIALELAAGRYFPDAPSTQPTTHPEKQP